MQPSASLACLQPQLPHLSNGTELLLPHELIKVLDMWATLVWDDHPLPGTSLGARWDSSWAPGTEARPNFPDPKQATLKQVLNLRPGHLPKGICMCSTREAFVNH